MACGILVLQPGIELMQWKHRVPTTGLPGKSPLVAFSIFSLSLILVSLINMYIDMFFLGFILCGILCSFWT